MKVFYVPFGLRLAALSLFVHVPLMILYEILMAHKEEWNADLTQKTLLFAALTFFFILPFYFGVLSGNKKVPFILFGLHAFLFSVTVTFAFSLSMPPLGFLGLTLFFGSFLQFLWIRSELKKPFLDPKLAWYEKLPLPIPSLSCQLRVPDQIPLQVSVSQIGEEGLFSFIRGRSKEWDVFLKKKEFQVILKWRGNQLSFYGRPVLGLERASGMGIQFIGLSPDQKKELGEWLEQLRGEGLIGL